MVCTSCARILGNFQPPRIVIVSYKDITLYIDDSYYIPLLVQHIITGICSPVVIYFDLKRASVIVIEIINFYISVGLTNDLSVEGHIFMLYAINDLCLADAVDVVGICDGVCPVSRRSKLSSVLPGEVPGLIHVEISERISDLIIGDAAAFYGSVVLGIRYLMLYTCIADLSVTIPRQV